LPIKKILADQRLFGHIRTMSALPPKADIADRECHVRFVPTTDLFRRGFAQTEALPSAPLVGHGPGQQD